MAKRRLKQLHPCPECEVRLQKVTGGPFGLAEHECVAMNRGQVGELRDEVRAALSQPVLEIDETQSLMCKVVLLRAWESSAGVSELTTIIERLAALKSAGTASQPQEGGNAGDDELGAWLTEYTKT